ncbi:unnamed protein product [Effrenium voratum]|nr:unnamed protein product [Effrenium voratum]
MAVATWLAAICGAAAVLLLVCYVLLSSTARKPKKSKKKREPAIQEEAKNLAQTRWEVVGRATQLTKEEMAIHLGRGPDVIEKERLLKRDALHVFRKLQACTPEDRSSLYAEAVQLFDSIESRGFAGMGALTSARIVFCNAVMECGLLSVFRPYGFGPEPEAGRCSSGRKFEDAPNNGAMAGLLAKVACFDRYFTWNWCCPANFGPQGNARCWNGEFNYDFCCKLAAWNQHDADIPYLFSTSLRVEFQLQNSSTDLVLQQHAMPGRSASDMVQALGQHWAAGFLWTGSYQLLRWFECDADLQTSWARREYIEFGGGVGASSIAAALKGAQVTVVDAFVSRTLLQNLQENLPPALWPRIAICQMNWTKALPQNLAHLRACLRQSRARPPELKFDLIACGTSLYGAGYLVPLMKAISKPRTRVLLAPSVSLPKYMELWGRITARYFERTTVRSDVGLTSVHRSTWAPHCGTGCPLFELSNPRGVPRAHPRAYIMGPPACAAREKAPGADLRVGFWERFWAPHMRRSVWWMN